MFCCSMLYDFNVAKIILWIGVGEGEKVLIFLVPIYPSHLPPIYLYKGSFS